MDITKLMNEINKWIKDILNDNYVGVYFHGSLRLGSFNPKKSDLDFIIVVKHELDYRTKELICDKMMDNIDIFPKKGFEFSVVLEKNCINFTHPTPYELHMSESFVDKYKLDKSCVINEEHKVDFDLASHFNVINVENDEMDFGIPAKDLFSKVPIEYIIDSNYLDTRECSEEIVNNPTYCVLNLCRFYALIKDELTLSKPNGGKWALKNMNSNYNDIIMTAIEDYESDTNLQYDIDRLKLFAHEAIELIDEHISKKTL